MRFREWLLMFGVTAVLVFVGVTSYLAFDAARRVTIEAGEITQPTALPTPPPIMPNVSPTPGGAEAGGVTPLPPEQTPTPTFVIAERDPTRVNILLLGVDEREIEEGPWRTDTMILFSLDPARKTISMLSIPRDLWVNIPGGYEPSRINNANFFGDATNYPGGGPALASRTVEALLGVPVDYYVLVNFEVFLTVVDTVIDEVGGEGVEICVPETIHDEGYPVPGSYDVMTVHFDEGCQYLDAEQLLQYARTRHGNSDFDRSARQQQIIRALRDEIVSFGGVQAMLGEAQRIWEAVRDGVRTDLTFDQIISMGLQAQDVPGDNIRSGIIDNNYISFGRTTNGDEVLIPERSSVQALAQMLFYPPLPLDELARLSHEREAGANIIIANGTNVQGLAAGVVEMLSAGGMPGATATSAGSSGVQETIIYVRTGRWYTAWYVASSIGLPLEVARPGSGGVPGEFDVLVILGADYAEQVAPQVEPAQ